MSQVGTNGTVWGEAPWLQESCACFCIHAQVVPVFFQVTRQVSLLSIPKEPVCRTASEHVAEG